MKEFVLLVQLPLDYGTEQALTVRDQWTALTDQWKAEGIFVSSFIFPGESYSVTADDKLPQEPLTTGNRRLVSCIIVNAFNLEAALALAKKCPVLRQEGLIEVRELQVRS